jgi:hypothetical protein
MQQPNIAQQIEQLIASQTKAAPGLVKGYESALGNAAQQDQQSIDSLRGLYSDPSKFEKSKLGAFGLGLMAPTKSGNFGEGMYNAFSGAMEAADYNREQNLSREEKLAKLAALQAQLTRQQATDQMSVFDKQSGMVGVMQGNEKTMADLNLRGAQYGPRELAPGEFGPDAPGADYFSKAQVLYNDYLTNPQKYAGAQGQKMVQDAIEIIKNERTNARFENVAGMRAQTRASPGQVALDKKFGNEVADWYASGGEADFQKRISQLRTAKMKLNDPNGSNISGPITGNMPDWVNSFANPEAINVRDTVAEVTQRSLREILGGQFAQKEGDALIARAFNPTLDEATNAKRVEALLTQMEIAYQTKREAIDYFEQNGTLQGFSKKLPTMADFENAVDNVGNEAAQPAATNPNAPVPRAQIVVPPEQLGADTPPDAIVGMDAGGNEILWEDVLFTAEQRGMDPFEVLNELQFGGE